MRSLFPTFPLILLLCLHLPLFGQSTEQSALLNFYQVFGGWNWDQQGGWKEASLGKMTDPCSWYGVDCNDRGQVVSLNLDENNLSGPWFKASLLGKLQELKKLDISDNHIQYLPPEIGSLRSLQYLIADHNRITQLPESMGSLQALSYLKLQDNQLDSLPTSLPQLTSLAILYLDRNLLSRIPSGMNQCKSLRYLSISRNRLSQFPQALLSLPKLSTLNLSYNEIACYPLTLRDLCESERVRIYSHGNPASYEAFCSSGTAACEFLNDSSACHYPPTPLLYVPSTDQHFIQEIHYTSPSASEPHRRIQVSYLDGYGRIVQQNSVGASPLGADIVQFHSYDAFGRETIQYLPFASSSAIGSRVQNLPTAQRAFYAQYSIAGKPDDTSYPYAETVFEASPLSRILEQGAAGKDWQLQDKSPGFRSSQEHSTVYRNRLNAESMDGFPLGAAPGALLETGFYPPGSLRFFETENEQGITSQTAEDGAGRTIFKRKALDSQTWACTYYLYDAQGRIRFILQPEGWKELKSQRVLTDQLLDSYAFQYEYDHRNRVIRKKIPGAGAEYFRYDVLDRIRATQNAGMRRKNQWLVTHYDEFDRPVRTGYFYGTWEDSQLAQMPQHETSTSKGYSDQSYPILAAKDKLSTTFYDTYQFPNVHSFRPESRLPGLEIQRVSSAKGYPTGTWERLLTYDDDMPTSLVKTYYYDSEGRVIQQISDNHLGGSDVISTQFSFSGEPLEEVLRHSPNRGSLQDQVIHKRWTYDAQGRLLTLSHQINHQEPVILFANQYDELGKLVSTDLHSPSCTSPPLFQTQLAYNLRGWLEGQYSFSGSTHLFELNLHYNTHTAPKQTPLFNGNISQIQWRSALDPLKHAYFYEYDDLDRLLKADYGAGPEGYLAQGRFSVTNIQYDLNGNIQGLSRYGKTGDNSFGLLDQLAYSYESQGNRLKAVSEGPDALTTQVDGVHHFEGKAGATIGYDASGNIIRDENKGIYLSYHPFNRPFYLENDAGDEIFWHYSASGIKLRMSTYEGPKQQILDYIGPFFYIQQEDAPPSLAYIAHEMGRLLPSSTGFDYEYTLRDHLGNTRLRISDLNGDGKIEPQNEILQSEAYYPFGMQISGLSETQHTDNRLLYNGKEYHRELGLAWYDYGFRWYDPSIARFPSVDPIAEHFPELTPYQYAGNTPIQAVDLDGLEPANVNDILNDGSLNPDEQLAAIYNLPQVKAQNEALIEGFIQGYIDLLVMGVTDGLGEFAFPLLRRLWGVKKVAQGLNKADDVAKVVTKVDDALNRAGWSWNNNLEKVTGLTPSEFDNLSYSLMSNVSEKGSKGYSVLIGTDKPIISGANYKTMDGILDIHMHGNQLSKLYVGKYDQGNIHYNTKNLASFINSNYPEIKGVRLFSCFGEQCGAQKLANILDKPVLASDNYIYINRSGQMFLPEGTLKRFDPK